MASFQAGLFDWYIRRLHLFGEDGADIAALRKRTQVVWPGMMHVFQLFAPFLPEARPANREISAFIRSSVGTPFS